MVTSQVENLRTESDAAPLLSVTVLNYNYAKYLPECLDSILRQTMTDFELIVINDCSTDNSVSVIEPYLTDPRVTLIDHKINKGYVASLIEGCDKSRGKYIAVISADDYALDSRAFEMATKALDADDSISLCYAAWHQVDNDANIAHTRRGGNASYVMRGTEELPRMMMSSPVLHSGAMIRRSAYIEVGGYNSNHRFSVDTNMWLSLCSTGKVAYIDEPLYVYRAHDTNMTNSAAAMWIATQEMLEGIDQALSRFTDAELPHKARLRRRAFQNALMAIPTLDIFAGRISRGWLGTWIAFKHYPALTLFQPRILALLARSIFGEHGFDSLRSLVHRIKPKQGVELEANLINA